MNCGSAYPQKSPINRQGVQSRRKDANVRLLNVTCGFDF